MAQQLLCSATGGFWAAWCDFGAPAADGNSCESRGCHKNPDRSTVF